MRTVRLQEASYDKEEILAINEVLDSTFVVMGKRVSQFEQTWSEKYLKSGPWDNDGRREIYKKAQLTQEKHLELMEQQ